MYLTLSGASTNYLFFQAVPLTASSMIQSTPALASGITILPRNWACAWDQQNGAVAVTKGQTTSLTLQRNEPYAFDFQAKDDGSTVTGGTVTLGTPVTYEVSLRNSSPVARAVRVLLWADRDKTGPYDFTATSDAQTVAANGGLGVFTFTDPVDESGAHYRQIEVQTLVNGAWVKSDSWPWGMAVKTGPDIKPPATVTGLTAEGGAASAQLQWTNPTNRDFAGVVVVRCAAQAATSGPAKGANCAVGAALGGGSVVYVGTGTSFTDSGLTNGTTYYYSVYSFDASHNYAAAVVDYATPGYPKQTVFEALPFAGDLGADIRSVIEHIAGVAWSTITGYLTDRFEFLPSVTAGLKFGFEVAGTGGEGLSVDIATLGVSVSVACDFAEHAWNIARGIDIDFVGDKLSLEGEEYIVIPTAPDGLVTVGIGLTGAYSLLAPPQVKVGINKAVAASVQFKPPTFDRNLGPGLSIALEADLSRQEFLDKTGQSSLALGVLDSFGIITSSWTESLGSMFSIYGTALLSAIGIGDDPLALLSSTLIDGGDLRASVKTAASAEAGLKVNAGIGLSAGVGLSATVYAEPFVATDLGTLTLWEDSFSLSELTPPDDVGGTSATATQLTACAQNVYSIASYDRDVFAFTSTQDQRHEFVVHPDTAGQFVVVIRGNNQDVLSRTVVSSQAYVTVPFRASDAGNYYFSIEGSSRTAAGTYSFQWRPGPITGSFEGGLAGYSHDGNVSLVAIGGVGGGGGGGRGDYAVRLREGSPASLSTAVTIPDIGPHLTFDYRPIAAGDGDLMQVRVNGTPLWSQPIGASQVDFALSPVIDLSAYAGQTVTLEFYLDSVGSGNAGFDVANIDLAGADSYVFCSPYGPAKVTLFDTTGSGLGDAAKNVAVRFGRDNSVSSITLSGYLPLTGVGIVVADASNVASITDNRRGPIGDLAFIASSAPIGTLTLKGGVAGYNLNGVSLGGLALPADVDGDGSTTDQTGVYVASGLSKALDIRGQVHADVVAAGGLTSFRNVAPLVGVDVVIGASTNPKATIALACGQIADVNIVSALPVTSLTAIEWLDTGGGQDTVHAPSVGSILITGRRANARAGITALAGRFDADMILSGVGVLAGKSTLGSVKIAGDLDTGLWDVQGNIGTVSAAGTSRNSLVRSSGDITGFTVGASDGSDFGAGVGFGLLQSDGHVEVGDAANAPTGTIKTFTVAGWRIAAGQPVPRFFIDSNISARIGRLNLLNWDGQGGLFAPSGSVKSAVYRDSTDKTKNWVYPPPPRQLSSGPNDFIHII